MAYNKAKAEKEWLRWKEAEETQRTRQGTPIPAATGGMVALCGLGIGAGFGTAC